MNDKERFYLKALEALLSNSAFYQSCDTDEEFVKKSVKTARRVSNEVFE